jgi:hypothetical protein
MPLCAFVGRGGKTIGEGKRRRERVTWSVVSETERESEVGVVMKHQVEGGRYTKGVGR